MEDRNALFLSEEFNGGRSEDLFPTNGFWFSGNDQTNFKGVSLKMEVFEDDEGVVVVAEED